MKRYYAILSGEHSCIPHGELRAILDVESAWYRVLLDLDGAAVFEAEISDPAIVARRSGWVREVGELFVLSETGSERDILGLVESIIREYGPPLSINYKRYKQYYPYINDNRIKKILRSMTSRDGVYELRVFITEGIILIGKILGKLDTRGLHYRRPGKRPFFRPGPLMPQITRAMINLARTRRGREFLDPFCGTGGFPLEACIIGASKCYCMDIKSPMIKGSFINLSYYKQHVYAQSIAASATRLPFRDESLPSIATDPPYGRSTSTGGREYRVLVRRFLEEAYRVLEPGGYVVYAGPQSKEPSNIALETGLEVLERYHMHVHSTLVREVVVARKPGGR